MKPDEPRKELKPEELLTAMIGKTIRTVNSTDAENVHIEFTDGTEVELKAENICFPGDCALIGYSPVYLNSRDIANMPMEKDLDWLRKRINSSQTQEMPSKPKNRPPLINIDTQFPFFSSPSDKKFLVIKTNNPKNMLKNPTDC
jgi:hypothetical protein